MFETFDDSEIKSPFSDEGIRIWTSAHQSLHILWLYVEYQSKQDGDITGAMSLLFNADQLLKLSNEPGITIKNVYLHTPGYINKSKYWKMDRLKSVSLGYIKSKSKAPNFTQFVLVDASELYFPELELNQNFTKVKDIFYLQEN